MPGVLAIIGVILLIAAGLNVAGTYLNPGWMGLAFVAAAVLWGPITGIAG